MLGINGLAKTIPFHVYLLEKYVMFCKQTSASFENDTNVRGRNSVSHNTLVQAAHLLVSPHVY